MTLTPEEVSHSAIGMVMVALSDIAAKWWHKLGACDGNAMFIFAPITCPVCLEEAAQRRAALFYTSWDAIGLGYVGR